MSRSYKKHSFGSWHSSAGMKEWRTQENRRLRHNAKQLINNCEDWDGLIIPVINDYGTLWSSPRDGKQHYWEKPLINQCEIDYRKRFYEGYTWIFNSFNSKTKHFSGEHYPSCNCYTNKKSWYWKNMRK